MEWFVRSSLLARRDLALGTFFERLAGMHGDRVAVEVAGEAPRSYRQLAERVARMASGMATSPGVRPGDRAVIATPNHYDLLLLSSAAARAGLIPVPVNAEMRADEIDHVVGDSGASLVVTDADQVVAPTSLERAVPAELDDVAAIFYTSGTTGKPKGAELTHRGLLRQATAGALWPSGIRRDEAVVALPVAHIMGFGVLTGFAVAGIPVYFLPKFRPDEVLDAIEERRATLFVGVPAMYRLLLEAGAEDRDLRSIRVWLSGADVMPPDLAARFQRMGGALTLPSGRTVGQAAFVEGYGMVELGGGVAAKVSPFVPLPFGDLLGVPTPPNRFKVVGESGAEVALGEVGELLVKGPGVLKGYHGDPEATRQAVTEDGWLHTGDLARRGPAGLVFFAGRDKDVIKRGGYSVFAVEVARALEEHPDILEAAVVGLPDERLGQVPAAAVRIRPGASVSEPELLAWAREHLAEYKAPVQVRILERLPRTGTNKVQKAALLEEFLPR